MHLIMVMYSLVIGHSTRLIFKLRDKIHIHLNNAGNQGIGSPHKSYLPVSSTGPATKSHKGTP